MVRIDQKKIGVAIMGAKADNDLWGQALAIESQYGDRGPEVITTMIDDLRRSGDPSGAAFWTKIAVCLTDLHEIPYVVTIASPAADGRRIAAGAPRQGRSGRPRQPPAAAARGRPHV